MTAAMLSIVTIAATVGLYIFATRAYQHWKTPLLLPVATVTLAIVSILLLFNIDYARYLNASLPIDYLLGPAVVALAYPLYQNRQLLKKELLPIISGVTVSAIVGIITGILLVKGLGFGSEIISSIAPKSVTTPVAIDISDTIDGIPSVSVVFVMVAGIFGAMISQPVFKWLRLKDPTSRGVGLGSAAHAIGTARALETSQKDGAVSTIAMILSALLVSILAPLISNWL